MADVYAHAVKAHKKSLNTLIHASEQEVKLRLPATRTSVGLNPFLGNPDRETSTTGETKGPYKCLWYDALSARSMAGGTGAGFELMLEQLSGQFKGATAFIELWLEDVLIDIADPVGETWVDQAQDVFYGTQKFKPLGSVRLGLSTAIPYLLMVVLKGGVGYGES